MRFAPFILVTLTLAALIGWFAPGGTGAPLERPAATGQEAAPPLSAVQDEAWNSGELILNRAGDGHFYADVTVGGASALMLVDTGASVVALTGEDADSLGVAWHPDDIEPVARGASGPVYGVPVTIDRMELGDFEARSIAAIVVPEGLGISLLGQSFLSRIPRVQMEQDRMILGS